MKKLRKQIVLFLILIISLSYYEVIQKPFPFINIEYTNSIETVNEFSFEEIKNYNPQNVYLATTVDMSEFEKITWAVEQARYLQDNSNGNFLRDKENIFEENKKFMNICSENSKILSFYLSELNMPNRIVWMDGHTVVEVYLDKKWVLIDSYGNLFAKNNLGNPASLYEVIQNYENMTFHKITNLSFDNLPEYTENNYLNLSTNVYSDQRLYVVLDNNSVDSLHLKNRDVVSIVNSIIGKYKEGVGSGIQLVLNDNSQLVGNFGIKYFEKIQYLITEQW